MPASEFQQPYPTAEDFWNIAITKMAILFGKSFQGTGGFATSTPGAGAQPAPPGFSRVYSYFGATNNLQTITYQQDAAVIGKVTFTYIAGGVADDDDIATEVWTAS